MIFLENHRLALKLKILGLSFMNCKSFKFLFKSKPLFYIFLVKIHVAGSIYYKIAF